MSTDEITVPQSAHEKKRRVDYEHQRTDRQKRELTVYHHRETARAAGGYVVRVEEDVECERVERASERDDDEVERAGTQYFRLLHCRKLLI